MKRSRLARWALWLWASPNTLIGLVLGLLLLPLGARFRRVDGVLEIAAMRRLPRRRWPFAAITLGHVILGTHAQDLERLRAHELVHVRQCERWGPLFLPAYLLAGVWQWVRGRDAYWDNPFEVEARRVGKC
ncbi:signal peptide prediction [Hydrogenophaga sp. ZJX-1]|uniref:signal peptide prediction n=1 Tax=Hydrogenophaga sp. ZJX-1 TaxID=3404778 RepID=UPI003B27E7F6